MSEGTDARIATKVGWLILVPICVGLCMLPIACRIDPVKTLARIPTGSKLSELDRYLDQIYSRSTVERWTTERDPAGSGRIENEFGSFRTQNLGDYEIWNATKTERDGFTGELLFFHHSSVIPDDLAPSYVFSLIYIDGS